MNPEGPNGKARPPPRRHDIRDLRPHGMNDEETVALIAGGHSLGKTHGAANPHKCVGREPEAASWRSWARLEEHLRQGNAGDTSPGFEGAWTNTPAKWSHDYLKHLFDFRWKLTKSPAGALTSGRRPTPRARTSWCGCVRPDKKHLPMMLTTDLALKEDPAYGPIARASTRTRRVRGSRSPRVVQAHPTWVRATRLLGTVSAGADLAGSVPPGGRPVIGAAEIATLKGMIREVATTPQLVTTAIVGLGPHRDTDKRGGANGDASVSRRRRTRAVNQPAELAAALAAYEGIQKKFNDGSAVRRCRWRT